MDLFTIEHGLDKCDVEVEYVPLVYQQVAQIELSREKESDYIFK